MEHEQAAVARSVGKKRRMTSQSTGQPTHLWLRAAKGPGWFCLAAAAEFRRFCLEGCGWTVGIGGIGHVDSQSHVGFGGKAGCQILNCSFPQVHRLFLSGLEGYQKKKSRVKGMLGENEDVSCYCYWDLARPRNCRKKRKKLNSKPGLMQ